MNKRAGADERFQQALAVAHRQQPKFWELRAATSLASLWRDQGKHTEAHDLLAPVYNWFTEGLDTPVRKDAKALLEQLSADCASFPFHSTSQFPVIFSKRRLFSNPSVWLA